MCMRPSTPLQQYLLSTFVLWEIKTILDADCFFWIVAELTTIV